MCQVSLKYVRLNGRGNDLKIPVFLVFFKNVFFFKFKAYFLQGIMGKIWSLLSIIIFGP